MVKKKKLTDFEDDEELIRLNSENSDQISHASLDKVSLDEFEDLDVIHDNEINQKRDPKKEGPKDQFKKTKETLKNQSTQNVTIVEIREEKPKKIINQQFKISFIQSYLQKLLSFLFIFLIIDVVNHMFKFFDGINILNYENYVSIYTQQDIGFFVIKIILLLMYIYFITPSKPILINSEGIYCIKNSLTNTFLLRSETLLLKWSDIRDAKLKHKLFEAYIYFYNKDGDKIGMLNFCLEEQDKFYQAIKKFGGANHPIYLISTMK